VKEAVIKKTLNHFELLLPRGPCVGTIAQPPLASHKNLTSSSSTNRGVPALAPSSSHPSSDRSSSPPSSLLDARWPREDSIVPWRFAPPRSFAPLELRHLGAPPRLRGRPPVTIAVPNSHNITQTYNTKINKYLELSVAMRNLWSLEKNSILPLIISATGIVPQSLFKNLKILDLENKLVVEIQKGILLYLLMSYREEIP
jgi:hypothetical protein